MARIEGIRIQNYRALRDVTIGKTFEHQHGNPLPHMIAVIGPNGSGKSTLLDAFGFLGDCLTNGVEEACERSHRGGIERLRTQGVKDAIEFELYYREDEHERPVSYTLHVGADKSGRAYVAKERFRQRRPDQKRGQPYSFVDVNRGKGFAWAGESTNEEEGTSKIEVQLG